MGALLCGSEDTGLLQASRRSRGVREGGEVPLPDPPSAGSGESLGQKDAVAGAAIMLVMRVFVVLLAISVVVSMIGGMVHVILVVSVLSVSSPASSFLLSGQ